MSTRKTHRMQETPQEETQSQTSAARDSRAAKPASKPAVQAVIFIGASSISMMVAEDKPEGLRVLDVLTQPLELVYDFFLSGSISRDTADRCVQVVRGYNDLLDEYRRAGEVTVRLLATNVLLDVEGLDLFVNRLQISCGLHLEVMDDGEMTRLIYLHMQSMPRKYEDLVRRRLLVLHVGPGNTRLLLCERGRITYYANYRLGAHRTSAAVGAADPGSPENEYLLVREQIRSLVEQMRHDAEESVSGELEALVVYGPDFHRLRSPLVEQERISLQTLADLTDEVAAMPLSQRMEKFGEDYATVRALLPTMAIYLAVAREFSPRSILLPADEYSHAFLRSLMPSQRDTQGLEDEVIHFSVLLAGRYHVDRGHSQQVRRLSCSLFDQLQALHRLTRHDRLLLKVAAILHEVGTYVSSKRHHKHSQYIILNSEIFGLSRRDIEIVGLLARYHRRGEPNEDERSYAELDLNNRLRVQKLAAILRVADALDRAHCHRIPGFTVRYANRRLELLVPGVHDLTLENLALRSKGQLFTAVFGYDVLLLTEREG